MKSRAASVALFVAAVLLGVFLATRGPDVAMSGTAPALPVVDVVRVELGEHRMTVRSHGVVHPVRAVDLVSEVEGRVVWAAAPFLAEQIVEAGAPLLRIDPADYELAAARHEALVRQHANELALARADAERARRLAERQASSQSRLEDASLRVEVEEAELELARVALREARRRLAHTEVRAPFAGRVAAREVEVGQYVEAGARLAVFHDTSLAEIRLPVHLDELEGLGSWEAGSHTEVRLLHPADGSLLRSARVRRVDAEIDETTQMARVIVEVPSPSEPSAGSPLAFGMFVEAELRGRPMAGVALLPESVLLPDGCVSVVDAGDRLRTRPVEVHAVGADGWVALGGLAEGELVCLHCAASAEGLAVRGHLTEPGASSRAPGPP